MAKTLDSETETFNKKLHGVLKIINYSKCFIEKLKTNIWVWNLNSLKYDFIKYNRKQ